MVKEKPKRRILTSDEFFCEFLKVSAGDGKDFTKASESDLAKKLAEELDIDITGIDLSFCRPKGMTEMEKAAIKWLEHTYRGYGARYGEKESK